jgi:cytochrome b6-f complex iron-sulfur subunit
VLAGTILTVAIVTLLAAAWLFASTRARRRDSAAAVHALEQDRQLVAVGAAPAPPPPAVPLAPDAYSITRRQFFNRSLTGIFALGLSGFGTTTVAFLWPTLSGGFGTKIKAGKVGDITQRLRDVPEPVYVAEGRFYLVPYPAGDLDKAREVYSPGEVEGMEAGVVALYQKCPHLGCRVPWCSSSQWFECPCHGSKYNRVGEQTDGPAPRGMDRFNVSLAGDTITVDTSLVVQGPVLGTDTTGQQPEGPHCAD